MKKHKGNINRWATPLVGYQVYNKTQNTRHETTIKREIKLEGSPSGRLYPLAGYTPLIGYPADRLPRW